MNIEIFQEENPKEVKGREREGSRIVNPLTWEEQFMEQNLIGGGKNQ